MSNEFYWRSEHTTMAKISRFLEMTVEKYGSGTNPENAKEDAITYATLVLEYFWDNSQPRKLAEEIDMRKREIVRWTKVLDQANRGNLRPLKGGIAEDAEILASDFRPTGDFGIALLNLANSVDP